jgi:S-adenosylmethionine hydrolase
MPRPIVAFLTDFGTTDVYVGVMKGVVLGICPEATLVDVTHDLAPQDIHHGAYALSAAYPHFPSGTIFVVVVDPGVGSARRGIAVESGGYTFVAPDNGVLTPAFDALGVGRIVALENPRYRRAVSSRTFEGRDRFAPAAAWLATGVPLDALGSAIADPHRITLSRPEIREASIDAHVVHVDRFGNLVTDLGASVLQRFIASHAVTIHAGASVIDRISTTYSDVPAGALCALIGSTDLLEISCRDGSAASRLGIGRGAIVSIRGAS